MRCSSPKTGSFSFYQEQAPLMNEESLWDMFKKTFKRVCKSTILVFPDSLSPLSPTSAATRTPKDTEKGTELTDEGDIYMEYSSQ
jgi:hypothetical protein